VARTFLSAGLRPQPRRREKRKGGISCATGAAVQFKGRSQEWLRDAACDSY
jgi:hypothetical protein